MTDYLAPPASHAGQDGPDHSRPDQATGRYEKAGDPPQGEEPDTSGLSGEPASAAPEEAPANSRSPGPFEEHGGTPGEHSPGSDSAELWAGIPDPPTDEELLRLRELLFQREIALIDRLQTSLTDTRQNAKRVSEVIAEALLLRGEDNRLNAALEPSVDVIIKNSLGKHQNEFVSVLFPLMGPSIRRSIAETFRSMLEGFSKSLEMSFSWRGLRWRIEALRSGKPFSEIVLLNTLVYRVEQLFFIHSDTGLVLAHLINEGVGSQDADMVSAMLTAIQDFVRDCFASGSEGELESLQMGEFTIFIEKYPLAYLACVVRGTPPAGFRGDLRATLETMLIEFAEPLESFSGDTGPFAPAARHLEPYLITRYKDEDKKLPLWAKALPVALVLALMSGAGFYKYHAAQAEKRLVAHEQHMQDAVRILRDEPGLMLVNVAKKAHKPWEVIAMKDELARSPEAVLQANDIAPHLFTFKVIPFISYDPSIVSRRAESALSLPASVSMTFDNMGVLTFTGTAPMSWIAEARDTARALPGVKQVDMKGVKDPMLDRITSMIREVEGTSIEFPTGKDIPIKEDVPKLESAVETLVELEKLVNEMGFAITLTIYGHADSTGLEKRNYEISQARTRTVAAMLYARGSSIPISMYGMGSQYPKGGEDPSAPVPAGKDDQASRRIEMRVHIARPAAAGSSILTQ